jgi:hypothetical protein
MVGQADAPSSAQQTKIAAVSTIHQSFSSKASQQPCVLTALSSEGADNMSPNSNQASAADGSTILTDPANSEGSTAEEDVEERDQKTPSLSPPSSGVSEHVMSSDEEMDEDNQSTAPSHSSNSDSTRSEQNSWFDYFTRAPGSQEPLLVGPSDWDDIYHCIRRRYKIPDSEPDCRQTLARMGHDSILIRFELPRQGHST